LYHLYHPTCTICTTCTTPLATSVLCNFCVCKKSIFVSGISVVLLTTTIKLLSSHTLGCYPINNRLIFVILFSTCHAIHSPTSSQVKKLFLLAALVKFCSPLLSSYYQFTIKLLSSHNLGCYPINNRAIFVILFSTCHAIHSPSSLHVKNVFSGIRH
jgi:hypothetical protein